MSNMALLASQDGNNYLCLGRGIIRGHRHTLPTSRTSSVVAPR